MLKSENARLNGWTFVDIRDVDLGSYVKEAQKIVRDEVKLPPGYSVTWSGQYEYLIRANQKLAEENGGARHVVNHLCVRLPGVFPPWGHGGDCDPWILGVAA